MKSLRRSPWHLFTEATKFEQVIHSLYLQKATDVFCCSFTLLRSNRVKETKLLSKSSYLSLMPCFATTTTMNYLNDRPSFHYSPKKNRGKLTFFSQQPRTFITEAGHHTTKLKLLLSPTNLVSPTTKKPIGLKTPGQFWETHRYYRRGRIPPPS